MSINSEGLSVQTYQTYRQTKNKNSHKNSRIIRGNGVLLPYLSVAEQLKRSIPSKHLDEYKEHFRKWQHFFQIDSHSLQQKPNNLDVSQLLLINFVHALSQEEKKIIFEDLKASNNQLEPFWQELLPIFKKIADNEKILIVLLTDNPHLSPETKTTELSYKNKTP